VKGNFILLSSALIANLFLSGACPQPQPPTCEKQRPIQIENLLPEENATLINPKAAVGANFDLLIGPRPIKSPLVLIVDGVNVTKQAQTEATGDIPTSSASIGFEPPKPLSPGKHTAEIRFADDQNKQVSYTWAFYVSPRSLERLSTPPQSAPQTKKLSSPLVTTPSTTPSQLPSCNKQRLTQISGLFPEENATVINPEAIYVGLDLLVGPRPLATRSLQLFIDKADVTKRSQFAAAKVSPTRSDVFFFKPSKPFSPGKHTAEVRFADDQNKQYSYTWNFYISAP
jgi:hypothetical protein